MGREEQTEEREVLDSIFPEEITGPLSFDAYTTDNALTSNTQTSPTPNTAYRYNSK